ncbi:MAG: hypothetical protein ACHQ49_15500 [Elusimicrobiota bacterium]
MLFLGHLGIGLETARPFRRGLPLKPLLLGTILPDLIDKPLYYGLSWTTGLRGAELGLISGTRTFGHTLLFTAALAGLAAARRSKVVAALALGSAAHLLLDVVSDLCTHSAVSPLRVLAWPLLGWRFPDYPYEGLGGHLHHFREPFFIYAELIGAALLLLEWRRRRRPL